MADNYLTLTGNLTADPELRFTTDGKPVANFTVAHTARRYDKSTGGYVDGDSLFMRCSVWGTMAENAAESLTKGARVVVQGKLTQRSYETREGESRTVVELQVDEVGASLRYATAKLSRVTKDSQRTQQQPQQPAPPAATPDPWAAPDTTQQTGGAPDPWAATPY
jgi:single-strand DNA-binding protein